ncbi:Regulator of chromosome condensation [Orchesella cincta]|uniref:Regulator of chromosome condensation n=1 Tax=Orchesella cincta TaxID=48709 RepID=A0A1D2MYZ1_ORCCI|nr:Regulator of chromosome condensation [Orchesella cincta]
MERFKATKARKKYLTTAGKHGVVVLPGNVEEVSINRCIQGPETHQEATFDYVEYMELNRLQALLHQVQRLEDAKKNPKVKSKANPPTDEQVKRLLESRYGPMDFDSPEAEGILQTMKESLMEQEEVEPNCPEIQIQLMERGIDYRNPSLAAEQLISLINVKFGGKLKFYQTLNPREASGEWFVVPRGDPELVRMKNFEQVPHPSKEYVIERVIRGVNGCHQQFVLEHHAPQAPEEVERPLTNLHLYDPKFEFSFVPPHRIFTREPKYSPYEEENLGIPKIMSKNIIQYLNNFPLGITPTAFLERIKKDNKGQVYIGGMRPSEVLRSHHSSEIWFANDVVPGLPELMLPGFLKNVVSLDVVLKRIWHAINCIVGMKSFVTVEHLLWLIEQIYSLKFDPEMWNFDNMQSFIMFCNKRFGASELAVHRLVTRMGNKEVYMEYVLIDSKYWRHHVEQIHGVDGPANLMSLRPIPAPGYYLHRGDEIDAYSNHLSEHGALEAVVECMTDPFNMFLVDEFLLAERDDFMTKLQYNDVVQRTRQSNPPAANAVDVGLYMLAFTKFKEYLTTTKCFRVLVVCKTNDFGSWYQVYAIDYGYVGDVAVKNLRYMPRGHEFQRPAFAIPVQVDFRPTTKLMKKRFKGCNSTLQNICKNLVKRNVSVKLGGAKFIRKFGCCKWTINCYTKTMTKDFDAYEIHYPDVETMIANIYVNLELEKEKQGNSQQQQSSNNMCKSKRNMSVFENGVSVDAAMLDESSEAVAMNAQVPSVNDAAVDHPAILAGDAEMPSNGDIVNENPSNSESDAVDQPRLNVNDNGSGVEPPPEQVDEVDAVNENDTGVSESSGESRKRKLPLPATEGGVLHFFGMAGRQYGVSEDQQSFPLIVESLKDKRIIAVACGKSHNIVLDDTGTVWSFGNNADNALGRPTPDKPFAINAGRVEIGKPVVQVSAGGSHSAALTEDGDVYAWGCFKSYQYKDRTFSTYGLIPEDVANRQSRETPTLISAHLGIQITKISSGENHLVMLGADKNVYSCGSNGYGQLGRQPQKIMRVTRSMGRVSGKPVPEEEFLLRPTLVKLARGPKIENIWTGLYTTFCSKAGPEGIHFAFGLNDCMQCGILNELKDRGIVTYPFRKTHLRDRKWRQVTGGRNHTIGLSQGGQVYTFGSPQYGKLGVRMVYLDEAWLNPS